MTLLAVSTATVMVDGVCLRHSPKLEKFLGVSTDAKIPRGSKARSSDRESE